LADANKEFWDYGGGVVSRRGGVSFRGNSDKQQRKKLASRKKHPAPNPVCGIAANGSGGLDIVWPDTYSGQLLWSPTIGPGAAWNPVGTTPVHVGGQYRVAITPTAAEAFYGLGR